MYLDEIIAYKKEEARGMKSPSSSRTRPLHDPVAALKSAQFIAEIKRSSPSRGDIRLDVDHVAQARLYRQGGAGAISVLTDKKYFKGGFGILRDVSAAADIPLLCKDFIVSEVQVEAAYASGADFILLIAAALDESELKRLSLRATGLGMKVLYEIHEPSEFDRIRDCGPELVGVNSRDLKTFIIDKDQAARTIAGLKGDFLKIAESGIETADDIRLFARHGADAFLVGTALMTSDDPASKLGEFASALREADSVR